MNKISILIVEDDKKTQKNFSDLSKKFEDLQIVGITSSSSKALDFVTRSYPDVIILDLELHDGQGNGIAVLNGLRSINNHPFIIVTTNNSSSYTYDLIRQLGVDFIFSKHQKNYSEKEVLDFIISVKDIIIQKSLKTNYEFETNEVIELRNKEIIKRLHKEFKLIGISYKYIGYEYLIEAIRLSINGQKKNIYSVIGNSVNKSSASVERAMQNTIDKAWVTSNTSDLEKYFKGDFDFKRGAPTVMEFIRYYTNELKADI